MKHLTIGLLIAATAGAVGWLVNHQRQASALGAAPDAARDPMVKQPPNVDPQMIRRPPNVDPKMIKQPPWPQVPAPQPDTKRPT